MVLLTPTTTLMLNGSNVMFRSFALSLWMPGGMIIAEPPLGAVKVLLVLVVVDEMVVEVVAEQQVVVTSDDVEERTVEVEEPVEAVEELPVDDVESELDVAWDEVPVVVDEAK
jgi:hypothetical protein